MVIGIFICCCVIRYLRRLHSSSNTTRSPPVVVQTLRTVSIPATTAPSGQGVVSMKMESFNQPSTVYNAPADPPPPYTEN